MPRRKKITDVSGSVEKTEHADGGNIYRDAPLFAGLEDTSLWQKPANPNAPAIVKTHNSGKRKPPSATDKAKSIDPAARTTQTSEIRLIKRDALLLSVADLCALLGVSRATLFRMDNGGKLPGRVKIGGSVRYHRETIENWLINMIQKNQS